MLPALVLAVIVAGLVLRLTPWRGQEQMVWTAGLLASGAPLLWGSARAILQRRFAADLVASLSILGALLFAQPLAGLVIVLMQSGGEALERFAEGRASEAVRALEQRAPVKAHRRLGDREEEIPVAAIAVGDYLLVRPGELVPCDGVVTEGASHLDTSSITGEALPVPAVPGTRVASGFINHDGPFTMRATKLAGESQYARIVELVRTAQGSKAPIQRLADRYATWFTPLTLVTCLLAWGVSGEPERMLAVLVVATPCPLILAAPVAILGGINRGARHGILFLHGSALEQLTRIDTLVVDKTGTLTIGEPAVSRVVAAPGWTEDELLALAASVERDSSHPLARPILREADERGLDRHLANGVVEVSGRGIRGTVAGREVLVGGLSWIDETVSPVQSEAGWLGAHAQPGLRAGVVVDGRAAGYIEFADQVRPVIPALLAALRHAGVSRTILLSGDAASNARAIGEQLGIAEAHGDLLPGDKTEWIERLKREGHRVLMLGDGVNDAPALAAATVGVALSRGHGGIASESADIVLTSDNPGRLGDAVSIAHRTLHIARQSIWAGLGLSMVAMAFAGAGYITPLAGAMLQEAIDVAVILNALRTIVPPRGHPSAHPDKPHPGH